MSSNGKAHSIIEVVLRAFNWVPRGGIAVSSIMMLFLMFYISADVIARYFFNAPLAGTLEMSRLMLVAIVFLAIAFTQSQQGNVKIEFLLNRLSVRKQAAVSILYSLIGIAIFALMAKQGFVHALLDLRYGVTTDIIHFPLFPAKLLVPLGASLMILQLLVDIIRHIQQVVEVR